MSLIDSKAPDFSLPDQDGNLHTLSDYAGSYVLLYFYPKDMTPGCTLEAQCFRDIIEDLHSANFRVFGVSCDSVERHKKFEQKENLNFPLLSDEDKKMVNEYGVWKEKSMYGKKYMGISRESFLINPEGIIIKHYTRVKPKEHAYEGLSDALRI